MRCDFCGKFRAIEDLIHTDFSPDTEFSQEDWAYQCRWCMSKADEDRYFPTEPKEPREETE